MGGPYQSGSLISMDIGKMVKGILIYLAAAIKKATTAGKATGATGAAGSATGA